MGGKDRTTAGWSSWKGTKSFIDCRELQKAYTPAGRRRSVPVEDSLALSSPRTREEMQFELEL
eukprot:867785-Amorphochlora_amoeboformis.AAC.1